MIVKVAPKSSLRTVSSDISQWLVVEEQISGEFRLLSHWRTKSEADRAVERIRDEHVLGRDG
mgnify:CR=1 FL=1